MTRIVGIGEVSADPFTEAITCVGVPAELPVKLEIYVPLPRLVTAPKLPVDVPPALARVRVAPEEIRLLAASLKVTVIPSVAPAATVAVPTVTVEFESEGLPELTVTVGSEVLTNVPPIAACIVVAVPAAIPVKVAL